MFGLNISPIYFAIAGAVIFGLVTYKAYDLGYDKAALQCDQKISAIKQELSDLHQKEVDRLLEANRMATEQQQKLAEELTAREGELDALLANLEQEAANDPDAGSCGINEGAVERLNRIGGGS